MCDIISTDSCNPNIFRPKFNIHINFNPKTMFHEDILYIPKPPSDLGYQICDKLKFNYKKSISIFIVEF